MSNTDSIPYYLMLRFNGEVAISHFIVFGLTLQIIKAMHCHSRGEQSNHFTMKVVKRKKVLTWKLQNISFVFHFFYFIFLFFLFVCELFIVNSYLPTVIVLSMCELYLSLFFSISFVFLWWFIVFDDVMVTSDMTSVCLVGGTAYPTSVYFVSSCCSFFSFLHNVLYIIVCSIVLFIVAIALSDFRCMNYDSPLASSNFAYAYQVHILNMSMSISCL